MYESVYLIRRAEERIAELYPEQEMRCPTHLSIGQEASAVGVCAALRIDDHVYSTHRCHAHYLAKGGDLGRLIAELYGKSTGCGRGKGGSMHLFDTSVGMMGASAIVSSSIPLAIGSALSFSLQGGDRVAVAFLGDAGAEQGTFAEALNFSAVRRLPMVFACENNLYSTQTPLSSRQALDNIYERCESWGVPGVRVDGNDVLAVYEAARAAVERCRRGEGPSLIEARTYRWLEHVGPNYDYDMGYRTKEELKEWQARDPVRLYGEKLLACKVLTKEELKYIENKVERQVEEAVVFAKESPVPSPDELWEYVY